MSTEPVPMPIAAPSTPTPAGDDVAHIVDESGVLRPLRTYLVEDSRIIRDNLIALLEETLPFEIIGSAENETDVRTWLKDAPRDCDLVIVDIFLKSGTGLGVLAARTEHHGPGRWVVLSNHATPEMREKCLQLGADAVFDKSNEIEALLLYCKRLAGLDTVSDVRNSMAAALD